MAGWNQGRSPDRLDRTAPGDRPDTVERLASGASIFGLAAIVLVVILAWMMFAAGPDLGRPDLGRLDDASPYAPDQMASQRIVDIAAERQVEEARAAASSRPDLIDAHVSSIQARPAP